MNRRTVFQPVTVGEPLSWYHRVHDGIYGQDPGQVSWMVGDAAGNWVGCSDERAEALFSVLELGGLEAVMSLVGFDPKTAPLPGCEGTTVDLTRSFSWRHTRLRRVNRDRG